jgi:hypothetical protein
MMETGEQAMVATENGATEQVAEQAGEQVCMPVTLY